MNENCVHRGKTTVCQVVCIPDNSAPVCLTEAQYSAKASHGAVAAFALVGLIVAIAAIMAIRATIQETRSDR
jgi:hypothetical protein